MTTEYPEFSGFDWDDGNRDKNLKHAVQNWECEQVFFNEPLVTLGDSRHSVAEDRCAAFGCTDSGRTLVVIYTMRNRQIRVISARDMNRRRSGGFMKAQHKTRSTFKTEDEERQFWATHSALDFFDVSKAKQASFPNLKPSLKSISIRLPKDMLDEIKILANKRDVPYQSLAKIYLAWGIRSERAALKPS